MHAGFGLSEDNGLTPQKSPDLSGLSQIHRSARKQPTPPSPVTSVCGCRGDGSRQGASGDGGHSARDQRSSRPNQIPAAAVPARVFPIAAKARAAAAGRPKRPDGAVKRPPCHGDRWSDRCYRAQQAHRPAD